MTPAFEVIDGGLQTTIQDAGRRGFEHLGVPRAGAADPISLAVANLLAGNEANAAAIECALLGPRLRALAPVTIGLAGADFSARMLPSGRRLEPGSAYRLAPDEILLFDEVGDEDRGCRAYIAIEGGIDVPIVLGSRSTSLVGGFGGLDGRALRPGDVLSAVGVAARGVAARGGQAPRRARWPDDLPLPAPSDSIRVIPDPAAEAAEVRTFLATAWTVAGASDRRGLRLTATGAATDARMGTADDAARRPVADRPSHGVVPGCIQITPSGQPLVLMPDAGTTGGYPVLAIVIDADLAVLGQLAPGAPARFVAIEPAQASAAAADRRRIISEGAARIR